MLDLHSIAVAELLTVIYVKNDPGLSENCKSPQSFANKRKITASHVMWFVLKFQAGEVKTIYIAAASKGEENFYVQTAFGQSRLLSDLNVDYGCRLKACVSDKKNQIVINLTTVTLCYRFR